MELTEEEIERELAAISAPCGGAGGRGGCPPENPDVKPITEELLILPHPDEPGVAADGTAAPLENPGRLRTPGRLTSSTG